MNGCKEIKERLCEFLDGELRPADRAGVESHVQNCAACREELSALREAASAVRTIQRRPAPASILAGVRAGLHVQPRAAQMPAEVLRPGPGSWWRPALSAAAVFTVATLIYIAYTPQLFERRAEVPPSPAQANPTGNYTRDRKAREPAVTAPAASTKPPETTKGVAAGGATPAAREIPRIEAAQHAPAAGSQDKVLADTPSDLNAELNAPAAEAAREARQDDSRTAQSIEALPAAQPPGTPPHVAEGERTPLSRNDVVQQLKNGWDDLTKARDTRADADVADNKEEKLNRGAASSRQVLAVSPRDLPRVLEDLRHLATSSGGELAWLPTDRSRSAKKAVQAKQQAPTMATPEAGRAVFHVPEARLAELVQATAQYQAQRRLDVELAEQKRKDAKSNVAGKPSPTKPDTAEYVQDRSSDEIDLVLIVLDIQPQALNEAAREAP